MHNRVKLSQRDIKLIESSQMQTAFKTVNPCNFDRLVGDARSSVIKIQRFRILYCGIETRPVFFFLLTAPVVLRVAE